MTSTDDPLRNDKLSARLVVALPPPRGARRVQLTTGVRCHLARGARNWANTNIFTPAPGHGLSFPMAGGPMNEQREPKVPSVTSLLRARLDARSVALTLGPRGRSSKR